VTDVTVELGQAIYQQGRIGNRRSAVFKHCASPSIDRRREIVPRIASKLRRLIEEAKEAAVDANERRRYERADGSQIA
jgi:hypothetical protein